jgi:hypothetical protein
MRRKGSRVKEEWPIGIWAIAQKTLSQGERGKLPSLRIIKWHDDLLKKLEKMVKD